MSIKEIVLLDSIPLDVGDIDWSALKKIGKCHRYTHTLHASETIKRSQNAEVILTNKIPISALIMAQLPKLKYIGMLATGYDIIDLTAARKHNIAVSNVPSYSTESVAELVFAYLLEHTGFHTALHHRLVVKNKWSINKKIFGKSFSYWQRGIEEIASKTIGLIGFGSTAKRVAEIALAFNMKVLATKPSIKPTAKQERKDKKVAFTTLSELLETSDFISLHCPLNELTAKMVNENFLQRMKNNAYLINTARGGLVDESALLTALKQNIIKGACLDVLTQEPPPKNHPLFKAPNIVITPHIAWTAFTSRQKLINIATDNLLAFIKGKRVNRLD